MFGNKWWSGVSSFIFWLFLDDDSQSEEDECLAGAKSEEDESLAEAKSEEDEHLHEVKSEEEEHVSKAQLEEDEQLAKAIQESLFLDSPPHDNRNIFQPYPFSFASGYRYICHDAICCVWRSIYYLVIYLILMILQI